MKVVYRRVMDDIQDVVDAAYRENRTIRYIALSADEWASLRKESAPSVPQLYEDEEPEVFGTLFGVTIIHDIYEEDYLGCR